MSTGYQLNVANSYKFMANLETVTIADNLGNPQGTIQGAKRLGGFDAERAPSRGKYLEWQVSWRLPQPNVSATIKPGWTVTDSNAKTYTVLDVAWPRNQNQAWQIYTNRLEYNGQLEDTVQYLQTTAASSSTGARTVTITAVGSPVAAAIEPERQSVGDLFGTKDMEESFLIYLSVDPSGTGPSTINAGDMFQDQNSVLYEIQDVFERDRLDVKPTFRVRKKL
jgi:hypothetical protein